MANMGMLGSMHMPGPGLAPGLRGNQQAGNEPTGRPAGCRVAFLVEATVQLAQVRMGLCMPAWQSHADQVANVPLSSGFLSIHMGCKWLHMLNN